MAWISLGDALEMALKQLEIDAEKMAESVASSRPSVQGSRTHADSEGDADGGAINLKPMLEALPTGKCLRTASPERVAPPFAVRSHLVVVVDNGGGRQTTGRNNGLPTYRASRGEAAGCEVTTPT